jgi:two-component system chemotaxis response regulator CheB
MDIHMPDMDGLTALEYIMRKNPLPVIMLSALAQKGAEATFRALELGAVDFITKPSHYPSAIREVRDEVILKVRTAAEASSSIIAGKAVKRRARKKPSLARRAAISHKLVIIGASAGGPRALTDIMPLFPPDTPAPIIIVQHMPSVFTRSFAERLDILCGMKVKEAEESEELQPGRILVAPGERDVIISMEYGKTGRVELMNSQNKTGATPRIDITMITAAETYGSEAIGVIMTGMGSDGAQGMEMIKKNKGATIAQDEDSCLVFGMPRVAIERGLVDTVVPLEKIPEAVLNLL